MLQGGPPIGCKVKREFEPFLDEFSACLVAADQTAPRQRPLVLLRFGSRRGLFAHSSFPARVFALLPAPQAHPARSRPRGGLPQEGARSASITKAHRALAVALTGGVALPLPEEGRSLSSPSRRIGRAAQLWSQRQHLLDRRQWAARAATCDMGQLITQPQAYQVCADKLA